MFYPLSKIRLIVRIISKGSFNHKMYKLTLILLKLELILTPDNDNETINIINKQLSITRRLIINRSTMINIKIRYYLQILSHRLFKSRFYRLTLILLKLELILTPDNDNETIYDINCQLNITNKLSHK